MSRLTLVVASVVSFLATCYLSRAAEPAKATEVVVDKTRQFVVECRIIDTTCGKHQATVCPKVTIFEDKRATITDLVQRPFVIAVSDKGGVYEPVIEVLPEGWTIEVCCHSNGNAKATLDVTLEHASIVKVDVEKLDGTTNIQRPQVALAKTRQFAAVRSGKPFTIPLDGKPLTESKRWADFVVIDLGRDANVR